MTEEQLLVSLGLGSNEAKVYLSLLKTGPTSIRQVSANTKINRGTTYESIKKLVGLGLVSLKPSGSRTKYSAESPDKIRQLIEEKQERLGRVRVEADKLLPGLLAFAKQGASAPKVSFYEDDEGVANILRDVLATAGGLQKKEYCVYSSRALRQYLYRRFPNFTKKRLKEKVFVKVIAIGTGGDPVNLAERKFIEESRQEISSSYNIIYGDKVALISLSPDLTPYGVVIEEPGVAAMQRLLFNRLWDSL